ncbi:MAG: amino acid ABC transporter substrate-binding protein [Polaromonas sp.]|uniref:amino acid ABC transporter substrate-binding protein n=1 Tax=Polaromonas sp. TaxID=1869339 RepID=UPI002489E938|nr:amino acid ABC transporter substrate-binding protein [Polaromonas sp.]MDI1269901.1 amino acid ABC transporter substrate-binding protein [Polaromonas sp.]MDP3250008.1 amino acid ABC transporter substrate-binding protein [Polaromonas sp.]MDP3757313.1 amino acid ABC transporter substrate-binding protein [Polaromonas sp.]
MKLFNRILSAVAAAGAVSMLAMPAAAQAPAPLRIGSTLALTGPLATTALTHKLAGEIYVDQLNARGGLLGRKVEWIVKDDQSKPELARTLYEQLVTSDKVDLLMGPYATGAILSAMGVAQRYNKVLVHHTFGIPHLAKYEMAFPAWSLGSDPGTTVPNSVFDALAASPKPPKTVAFVTSKFPSIHFMSLGAREVAKKRGLQEVLFLEWDFGNRDFGPIAARVKDAKPDLVWIGDIGLEGNMLLDAMKKIDYVPPLHFHTYPAPGPMTKSPDGKNALSLTIFEEHAPFTASPVAAEFVKLFNERATKANLPDTSVEVQAAASYSAWQILEAGVRGANSFDDKAIGAWLRKNRVETIHGRLRFDGPGNYGDDLMKIKQVQNGKWVVVHPAQFAPAGVKLQVN